MRGQGWAGQGRSNRPTDRGVGGGAGCCVNRPDPGKVFWDEQDQVQHSLAELLDAVDQLAAPPNNTGTDTSYIHMLLKAREVRPASEGGRPTGQGRPLRPGSVR
jgi:hypothetical protein